MKSVIKMNRLFVPYILLFSMLALTAKSQEGSKDELEAEGTLYFLQEDYDEAMNDFKVLHNLYPKDAEISYYLGRCYLHCSQNADEAARLLKFSATRNFGDDAYFFLGRAYHLNYQFDEADMAFATFKKTAKSKYIKEYDVDYWIDANKNAKKSVTAVLNTPLVKKEEIPVKVPESAFAANTEGKYIYVPDEFRSATDKTSNYQTIMFLSKNVKVGDYLYFDTKSLKSKTGTDIYRVKRLANDEYSIPEKLSDLINTDYDEAYPFFDKATSTLYFSSKGFNTSGGFDIFYTRLNESTRQWSTPEKLEFPINTPYDDYLYTPDNENKSITFLSNRNSGPGNVESYTIPIVPSGEYLSLWSREDIEKHALFKNANAPADNLALKAKIEDSIEEAPANPDNNLIYGQVKEEAKSTKSEYELLLAEALSLQSHSDSLNWCIKDLKKQAIEENNYQKKQQLSSNASILEKEAQRIQSLASAKFIQAEKLRGGDANMAETQTEPQQPAPLEQNLTVIAYPEEVIDIPKTPVNETERTISYHQGYNVATQVAVPQITENFKIEGSSPYSKDNPIPFLSKLPDGLIYRIQLGAFSGIIEENAFKGLSPISAEKTANKDITKYYVGYFSSIEIARKALNEVKSYGYPDAFLVSYYNNEKISIQKAREIEFAEK